MGQVSALRILRRLSRNAFPGISPKTIARIERKETEKPHGMTLDALAKVLAVAPEEIESY
jgi:transcriptional regulator with XRE-family HTH domain